MRLTDNQLVKIFTDLLGEDSVVQFDRLELPYLHQRIVHSLTSDSIQPACVLYPKTIAELSSAIAVSYEHCLRVLPFGNATKLDWGGLVSRADIVISTSRLNQIIEHCVGDLTVTVEAGVKYQDLQLVLAKEGQFLAIDPPYGGDATIGGILATGSAGSMRHRYNSVRDMCLGIEFVRADGEIVKAGGRVVKNVAGYDLMKLLTGSYGTLGVASSITFRLYPLPEYTQTAVITGAAELIAQAHQRISTSVLTPTACDLLSSSIISALSPKFNLGDGMGLAIQFSSLKASVIEQGDRINKLAKDLNLQVQIISDDQDFWRFLDKLVWNEDARNLNQPSFQNHVVCKLGILPSAIISTIKKCEQIFGEYPNYLQVHMGSGLGILRLEDYQDLEVLSKQVTKMRSIAEEHGGFLTILESPHELKSKNVWGYTGNAKTLMCTIQQQFDPKGLLSPNRML